MFDSGITSAWNTLHLMKILRSLLITSIALGLVMTAPAQERRDPAPAGTSQNQNQTGQNRAPVINSFTASVKRAAIPCPSGDDPNSTSCTPNTDYTMTFTTDASDPDGDSLLYKYSIRAGRITGEGKSVVWDYAGLGPGSYVAKVEVNDQQGHVKSRELRVALFTCGCLPACPTLSVSAPPEPVDAAQAAAVSASISGGPPNVELIYKWSVSEGTITSGQGTLSITISTEGLAGKRIRATIEVEGLAPECQKTASAEFEVRKPN